MTKYSVIIISDFREDNLVKKIKYLVKLICPMNLGKMSEYTRIFIV